MSKQEVVQKLQKGLNTTAFHFGVVKNASDVSFEFIYTGEIPLLGARAPSCPCTRTLYCESGKVHGTMNITASDLDRDIYVYQGQYYDRVQVQGKIFYQRIGSRERMEETPAIKDQIKIIRGGTFQKHLTIYADDGQPIIVRTERGEIKDNPEKGQLSVSVTGFVI